MKIDVVASETHYQQHSVPIWAALPDELRGTVWPIQDIVTRPPMGHIAMVSGWKDIAPLRGQCEMIYVEHGAGQTYSTRPHDPSYSGSGGQRHRGVIGYIAPSQLVADRWTNAPAIAVGCPKMDHLLGEGYVTKAYRDQPTVCFAWHWDATIAPESRTAWPWYEHDFDEIVMMFQAQGFRVVAHEHPRWRGEMNKRMASFGIETLEWDEDVFDIADILIVDNSSLATEFMLLGRPVIFMNAPWYRREINHGGRFWEWTIGHPIVDSPEELLALNLWDYMPMSEIHRAAIERTAAEVYAYRDGTSSERAAAFIAQLVAGR